MVNATTRRSQDLFTAAAVALLLLMSTMSQGWVLAIAGGLIIIGLVIFPQTRRLGLVATVTAVVAAATTALLVALFR